jgi:hypothetical protein
MAGRESTNVFESYHKLNTKNYLGTENVKLIGELTTTKFPLYSKPSGFYDTIRKRAEDYFEEKKINPRDINAFVFFNTIFIFTGVFYSYYMSMYANTTLLKKIFYAILAGVQ